jgi:hypothetical protein
VIYEDVQHRLRFSLDHHKSVKMAVVQFYIQWGKQRKLARINVRRIFGEKLASEEGRVSRCVVVLQQSVLLSPKFGAKSSHISTQSP